MEATEPRARFDSKTVMVTGASRGIGRATAIAFAQSGAHLVLTASGARDLEDVVAECRQIGATVLARPINLSSPTNAASLIHQGRREFGKIDILINNAGKLGPLGPLSEADPEEWLNTISVNLGGTFSCTRFVLPSMIAQGSGCIINIASASGQEVYPNRSAYAASKAAILQLTRVVAEEVQNTGIRIVALFPSPTESAMQVQLRTADPARLGEEEVHKFQSLHERGELGTPERAAACIVALAGPIGKEFSGKTIDLRDISIRNRLLAGAGSLYS